MAKCILEEIGGGFEAFLVLTILLQVTQLAKMSIGLFACEVTARIHADLDQPPSVERELVHRLRNLSDAGVETVNRLLEEAAANDSRKLVITVRKSLWCYFICSSETQLQQLHNRYESGHMKIVFEKIFSFLVNRTITIRELKWTLEEFEASLRAFRRLNSPGECHVNNDVIANVG